MSPAAISPVQSGHVWAASGLAVAGLILATLLVCGFRLSVVSKLIMGADNRASTSKAQAAAWTYAICFALLTLLFGHLVFNDFDDGWRTFTRSGLDSDYLFLLGIPAAGLVGAKAITQTKVNANPALKPKAEPKPAGVIKGLTTGLTQLGTNDDDASPAPALADIQYLIFNIIALIYFLSAFLDNVQDGLPSLPGSLIALTGVSAASYLANKAAVTTAPPAIISVVPNRIVLSDPTPITIAGTGFMPLPAPARETPTDPAPIAPPPSAMLAGLALTIGPDATGTRFSAMPPSVAAATAAGVTDGILDLVVISSAGTESAAVSLTVTVTAPVAAGP